MTPALCHYSSLVSLVLCCQSVFAAAPVVDPDKQLLEELQYLKEENVSIASRIPQTERDAPAILTVITEKEILNSGARDLIDVLRLVPGFDFGVDFGNIVGPMIRGNWAYEGGILMLIDGLEMNERRSGSVQMGQHYPIDNIQKIEVMRGPGSFMYGGFARLGVVNIITKGFKNKASTQHSNSIKDQDQDELAITTRYGQMEKTYGHRGVSFYAGKNLTDDARITVSGKASQAHRSEKLFTDTHGGSVGLENTNLLNNMQFNIGFQYAKNLTLRFIMDDYVAESADGTSSINSPPLLFNFKSYVFDAKYQQDFSDALRLSFNFNYSRQLPWNVEAFIGTGFQNATKISSTRYLGGVRLDYMMNNFIHITSGLEFTHEEFEKLAEPYDYINPKVFPIYENITPYIESLIKSDWGNLTFGLRYDKHNTFDANLAPRVAFTNKIGGFHYKLLYSSSFRTPNIDDAILGNVARLKPEHTKAYEIELGYQFNKNLSLTTNAFYLSTKDKLVYGFDNNNTGVYSNAHDKIESTGVETEVRWKQNWGYLTLNHSYSQMLNNFAAFKPIQQLTNTLVSSDKTLGFPTHKFTLNTHYEITPDLSVNPSFILTTSRYGYDRYDAQGYLNLRKYSPQLLGNLYFRYQNALIKGLDLGIGVYNLFNANQRFIQPYNSDHAPLPGQSREVIFKISYQL
jgi:outer membrane receptor for ferrienterochelin and colicin